MYFTPALALLPTPIRKSLHNAEATYHKMVEVILNNQDKITLIQSIQKEFPNMLRRPDGRGGYSIMSTDSGVPSFCLYACVASFGEASGILARLKEAGYKMGGKEYGYPKDNKYNMSREFRLEKKSKSIFIWDYIYLTLFALKELGANCKAVSIGYDVPPGPESYSEKFVLVCDEIEEIALKQDVEDPNFL